jgi:hypothetical protein
MGGNSKVLKILTRNVHLVISDRKFSRYATLNFSTPLHCMCDMPDIVRFPSLTMLSCVETFQMQCCHSQIQNASK